MKRNKKYIIKLNATRAQKEISFVCMAQFAFLVLHLVCATVAVAVRFNYVQSMCGTSILLQSFVSISCSLNLEQSVSTYALRALETRYNFHNLICWHVFKIKCIIISFVGQIWQNLLLSKVFTGLSKNRTSLITVNSEGFV